MKTIWKFPMPSARCLIEMPVGAQVIRVAMQPPSDVQIWAIVESDNALEKRSVTAPLTLAQMLTVLKIEAKP